MNAFQLRRRNMIISPIAFKYASYEYATVSEDIFRRRFSSETNNLFNYSFQWDNVCFAGGFISGIIDAVYDPETYKYSDIDMFVYGENSTIIRNKIKYIIRHVQNSTSNSHFITGHSGSAAVIDCIIEGWKRRLQIVGTSKTKIETIIQDFDFTHCKIAFDNNGIHCAHEFIDSILHRETIITQRKRYVHAHRFVKAYLRGYSIVIPYDNMYAKNFTCYNERDRRYTQCIKHPYDTQRDECTHLAPHNTTYDNKSGNIFTVQYIKDHLDEFLKDPTICETLRKNILIDFSVPVIERFNCLKRYSWMNELRVYNKYGCMIANITDIKNETVRITSCDDEILISEYEYLDELIDTLIVF